MKSFLNKLYKRQSSIYRIFLFICTTALIVYLFPKGGIFKYEFTKGKPWQYENLYAPFDFAIAKTEAEIEEEKKRINDNVIPYFEYDTIIANSAKESYDTTFSNYLKVLDQSSSRDQAKLFGRILLNDIYRHGVLQEKYSYGSDRQIFLNKGNTAEAITYGQILTSDALTKTINSRIDKSEYTKFKSDYVALFYDLIKPNVRLNKRLTESTLEIELEKVLTTRGGVSRGSRIIAKGEVVEGDKLQILNSLKAEYESQVWSDKNFYWIVLGYCLLVSLALMMLLLFIKKYRTDIYENNTQVTFIFFNVLFLVLITTLVVKYRSEYIYVVPLCILPLVLKAFFDSRLGLFTHVITVLILGFVVPNSYEYTFLQIIAGIVTILTISESFKRANLFISVGQITLIYILAYIAFHIIHEGSISNIDWVTVGLFVISGFATLIVHPLIYAYEKVFGLISDVSLLELSDTNSVLLKELSNKAPGTFHHSLNVANIAEAAANEIGANAMLVRVGALYHDIGKMANPTYFTENQSASGNAHDVLSPRESAKIIINHVIRGIEIAKKNNLPDRVIDFIRTHHGTSTVYYFYSKEKETNENVNIEDFRYPGPKPFSKETAILMMSDSVEAASKSLKNPTSSLIDSFVEKIVSKQMEDDQFLNANITFKEIQQIKKVFKRKLTNIYHLRIEYPE
ncbi:putative nucleotidyltransferase with HDIG domain [Aquimarina sp. EL_43]|uniref:HD family phosphohydrolase n=1 Tax=unclassified Aquimarina TaxID=2627091 RepID=UPI0018CB6296|nr:MULTISPECIES: HDIG domain-containing metalloprotein [unclassified Aquimarina]MBG6129856.1 putative nucleotidyltransferase with HDIG domain [Aquimarina sp. EL_35]MBG6150921.1 putative nucleotidyltransferase with HDIG domain [Aquimarina sp. EL_32]MBG6167772.1 putative nucleotidyltransferase with HDIG domain [Aquimarina sp. EL_43]